MVSAFSVASMYTASRTQDIHYALCSLRPMEALPSEDDFRHTHTEVVQTSFQFLKFQLLNCLKLFNIVGAQFFSEFGASQVAVGPASTHVIIY